MATKKKRSWRTTTEVAAELEVTDRQVRKLCEQGKLPALQVAGGRWRIYRSEKERMAAARVVGFALI